MQQAGIELNQQMLPVFLVLLVVTTAAWLFISARLYHELRKRQLTANQKPGKPGLVKYGIFTNFRVISLVCRQNNKNEIDKVLLTLCQGLRLLLWVYLVCLAGTIILLLNGR